MRPTVEHIATALLETLKHEPEKHEHQAVDAALAIVRKEGLSVSAFVREVKRLLPTFDTTVQAVLESPVEEPHAEVTHLHKHLEQALKKPVFLTTELDPSLLGGAVLTVGDDRYDFSIRGALDTAKQSLTGSSIGN